MTDILRQADEYIVTASGVTAWREPFLLGLGTFLLFLVIVGLIVWVVRG
jgi:hypothetical protein